MNGFATPNGDNSLAWFEWGASRYYGSTTSPVSVGGSNVLYVTAPITGLINGQTYYYRLVVSNGISIVRSFEQRFGVGSLSAWGAMATTPAGLTNPIVITSIPTGLTNTVQVAANFHVGFTFGTEGKVTGSGFGPTGVPAGLSNTNGVSFQWQASTNEQFEVRWTTNLMPPVRLDAVLEQHLARNHHLHQRHLYVCGYQCDIADEILRIVFLP